MNEAVTRAGQRKSSDEEDGEHDVGEHRREVDHLARRLDALHGNEEDDDPGQQQAQHDPPLEATGLLHGHRGVQGGAVPEVGGLRRDDALLHLGTVHPRALRPRQWTLTTPRTSC